MTVTTENSQTLQTANGVAVAFTFDFQTLDVNHIDVYVADVLDAAPVVTLNADQDANPGGTVTFAVAPANLDVVSIVRGMDYKQLTDYVTGDAFPSASHETALDKMTMIVQQLANEIDLSIRFPESEDPATFPGILPAAAIRANLYLAFDANGNISLTSSGSSDPNGMQRPASGPEDNLVLFSALKDGKDSGIAVGSVVLLTLAQVLANKTLTAAILNSLQVNGSFSGDAFLDEDAMGSNSAVKVASQQSIKAYVDAQIVIINNRLKSPPPYLHTGNGADGVVVQNSNENYVHTSHEYTTFTLDAGNTLTLQEGVPLILRATTSITINGTINANGQGGVGGPGGAGTTPAADTGLGGTGGGGGDGSTGAGSGKAGAAFLSTAGGSSNSGAGNTVTNAADRLFTLQNGFPLSGFAGNVLGGTGGGGGGAGGSGGSGGAGGGVIILIAPSITIGAAGIIDVGGNNGASGSTGGGGGGGGGGGCFVAVTDASGYTNNGTVIVAGGAGGSGAGSGNNGGVGGAGFTYEVVRN